MCNRATECVGLQEVRKASPAVDFDDGNPLAIFGFQRVVAGDVDVSQLEAQFILKFAQLLERALAQVATLRVKDGYLRSTGRCHA